MFFHFLYCYILKQNIMKKIWITSVFMAFSTIALAQQDDQQPNDDQIQQQAPRETQRTLERSSKAEAVKQTSNAEVDAEKEAKEKAQSQKQTKAQPVGLNPADPASKKAKRKN